MRRPGPVRTMSPAKKRPPIRINKIDTGIRELAPVAQPLQIVAEVRAVHSSLRLLNALD
jgi:hypothetical protein